MGSAEKLVKNISKEFQRKRDEALREINLKLAAQQKRLSVARTEIRPFLDKRKELSVIRARINKEYSIVGRRLSSAEKLKKHFLDQETLLTKASSELNNIVQEIHEAKKRQDRLSKKQAQLVVMYKELEKMLTEKIMEKEKISEEIQKLRLDLDNQMKKRQVVQTRKERLNKVSSNLQGIRKRLDLLHKKALIVGKNKEKADKFYSQLSIVIKAKENELINLEKALRTLKSEKDKLQKIRV